MTDRRLVTAEVRALLDAAAYIEAHGHAQRTYWDRDGSVCMLGALRAVRPARDEVWTAAYQRLWRYLGGEGIVTWNDAEARTKDEVVAALRAAALMDDERASPPVLLDKVS